MRNIEFCPKLGIMEKYPTIGIWAFSTFSLEKGGGSLSGCLILQGQAHIASVDFTCASRKRPRSTQYPKLQLLLQRKVVPTAPNSPIMSRRAPRGEYIETVCLSSKSYTP